MVVPLVVSSGFRKFFFGAVCVLGVAGFLLYMYQQRTKRDEAPGVGKNAATIWEQRSGKPGTQAAPTSQERPAAVSTPEEAAQAVQRHRVTQDLLRRGQGDQPALSIQQADVSPQPDIIEGNVAVELAGATTAPATLGSRVTPIPRVTVILPSGIPPRATLTPPATPTSRAISTPSVTPIGSALKSCDALKAEIQAKLDAKSITGYALTIMTNGDLKGPNVVGSCEGNTKKIVLNRSRNAP